MVLLCIICRKDLEQHSNEKDESTKDEGDKVESKDKKDINISALLCGHVFHTFCIQKIICENLESSKHCPYCKSEIKDLKCVPLFPANQNSDLLSSPSSSSGSVIDSGYGLLLHSQNQQIENLQRNLNDTTLSANLLVNDLKETSKKLRTKTETCDLLEKKLNRLDILEDLNLNYRLRTEKAEGQLSKFKRIKTIFHQTMDSEQLVKNIKKIVDDAQDLTNENDVSCSIIIPQSITKTWSASTTKTTEHYTFLQDGSLMLTLPPLPPPLLPKDNKEEGKFESHAETSKTILSPPPPPPKPFLSFRWKGNGLALLWSLPLDQGDGVDDDDKQEKPQPSQTKFFELYVLSLDVTTPPNLIECCWRKLGNVTATRIPKGARIANVVDSGVIYVVMVRGVCEAGQSGAFSNPVVIFPRQ